MAVPKRSDAEHAPGVDSINPIPVEPKSSPFERWYDLAERVLLANGVPPGRNTRPSVLTRDSARPESSNPKTPPGNGAVHATIPLVLCVEDHPRYLDLRKAVLKKAGFSVIGVTNTEAALQEVLKDMPVCCTIADHMLKGETGTALAKQMKAIKPTVPIVLHSGTVPERLEAVDVYVNKGEPTEAFLSIVRAVVQRYCS